MAVAMLATTSSSSTTNDRGHDVPTEGLTRRWNAQEFLAPGRPGPIAHQDPRFPVHGPHSEGR